ncbi:hypothetical protein [Oxynema aestuarii]|nr:hypothetical protein [Oxynema aestuarii]
MNGKAIAAVPTVEIAGNLYIFVFLAIFHAKQAIAPTAIVARS